MTAAHDRYPPAKNGEPFVCPHRPFIPLRNPFIRHTLSARNAFERMQASGRESRLTQQVAASHTPSMKAAVSIPNDIFAEGEALAHRLRTSRSQLYARALADFVVQHEDDKITAAMNQVLDDVGTKVDEFSRRAARRTLRHVEW